MPMDYVSLAPRLPSPADPDQARIGLEHWAERAARAGLPADADPAACEAGRQVLASLFGNSSFLGQLALADPAFLCHLVATGPERSLQEALAETAAAAAAANEPAIMAALRRMRQRVALTVALADIAGLWTVEQITQALSDFAETALESATRFLLLAGEQGGQVRLDGNPDNAGLVVLGMGKLGARELNYSSDIDLIVLYDADKAMACGLETPGTFFVRLTRSLVKILSERTAEGYVFRTDLRLRPDPGSTPLAISVTAAETYYESVGQNWERAAMIKARPVAGDRATGQEFLSYLRPYVWRKSLDFAAIQDIHSIKRQINAHRGGGAIALHGHNIKLGRGGIREIEFFAQTQQLIYGGRTPELRGAQTIPMLFALAAAGMIEQRVAEEMATAYRFLRKVEHRLQMIADEQTHTLPASDAGMRHLAIFLGYPDAQAFAAALLEQLRIVERHYAHLFEDAPSLSGPGNLVFTGAEDDPETLKTLAGLGFGTPSAVASVIRQWHHGRYRATITARSRELLTELIPTLLKELGATAHPDGALMRFDQFLARLPAGVQLFSLFYSNPDLLRLVATIMGSAPRVAERLAQKPSLLDAVLDPGFLDALPSLDELLADAEAHLARAGDYQDVLDLARRWAADRRFQIGVQLLTGRIDAERAGQAFADVAQSVLSALCPRVEAEFARQHGGFGGTRLAVVAMGKLGSREMTVTSDLDLMFVYDLPPETDESDGEKPLPPAQYYSRLSQRIINAITTLTNEGQLYEVDMRLRPSGNAGPLACSVQAFETYQRDSAWTWEHMALVRARVILGPRPLCDRLDSAIAGVLTRPRDPNKLLLDVASMRDRIERHNRAKNAWDLKYLRGGLFDLDFLAQYLLLLHAPTHQSILARRAPQIFAQLAQARLLPAPTAQTLAAAFRLWQGLQALLRLTMGGDEADIDEATAPEGLKQILAAAAGVADFAALKARMAETAAQVYALYEEIVAAPAARLGPLTEGESQ
ncbi:MAG: bifunctional [glutamine synthetase] adenylyltransferase/[glutamine synthetase]-adenylyl-L-tyrosine phosphorylase [Reyranellaceae bacterium]